MSKWWDPISTFVAARLGLPTILCSAVGGDNLGQTASRWLSDAGVDLTGLVNENEGSTAYTTVITDKILNRLAFHHRGVSATYNQADLPDSVLQQASTLLISGYPLLPAWRSEGVIQTLAEAKKLGIMTAFDIGPAIGEPAVIEEISPFLNNVDYFICNAHELAVCTHTEDINNGMSQLLEAGVKRVIIKQGAEGAVVREADYALGLQVPGFRVQAQFTVGAGDSFNAGFLYGIMKGWDLRQATVFANATAALTVSSNRGVLGSPTLDAVLSILADTE
ncbi:MAG: carbohydrate kinase family protein [Chloroflexota bacterium]